MQRNDPIWEAVYNKNTDALQNVLEQNIKPKTKQNVLALAVQIIRNCFNNEEHKKAVKNLNLLIQYGYANNPKHCTEVLLALTASTSYSETDHTLAKFIVENYAVDWGCFFGDDVAQVIKLFIHHETLAKLFFKHGKEECVDRTFNGLTILHYIAQDKHFNKRHSSFPIGLLDCLFEFNANPTIRDPNGNLTPYQMARKKKNHNTAEKIKKYILNNYEGNVDPADSIENQENELKGVTKVLLPQQNSASVLNLNIAECNLIPGNKLSIQEMLGRGGYGTVYQAKWQYNIVAVKILNGVYSDQALNSFVNEANLFFSLRHPNILTMYGLCKEPQLGIVMEYIPRGSLFKILHSNAALSWEIRIKLTSGIARGLQYLHDHKILHRDLKSENVLVSELNEAKLSDFGLSIIKQQSAIHSLQSVEQVVGTLPWMAPELFCRKPYTYKADMYSLGMVMWEIATRETPWQNESAAVIVGAVVSGQREKDPANNTPSLFTKYMKLCWFQEPERRPSIEEVVNTLENIKPTFT